MKRMEVEQKFAVADFARVKSELARLEAPLSEPRREIDTYYQHPARDFAATDEALRIRHQGGKAWITFKGPKIDATTKTREEIDLLIGSESDTFGQWANLLHRLGFTPVAEVAKTRWKAEVNWQGRRVEVSLDEVAEVGTYVELELVVDFDDVPAAKSIIASLAQRLGLSENERRSYLKLLLTRRSAAT